jgi:cytochrome c oxidase subunit IV
MNETEHHIVSYKTYATVLAGLLILTALSVAVTRVELGPLTIFAALFLASVKGALVLGIFMHLKFDQPIYRIMIIIVILLFAAILIITLSDYLFR